MLKAYNCKLNLTTYFMNYVITGSIGHISKPIVKKLKEAGHHVTVITSNSDRVKEIESLGATAFVG